MRAFDRRESEGSIGSVTAPIAGLSLPRCALRGKGLVPGAVIVRWIRGVKSARRARLWAETTTKYAAPITC
jgi:hypothetical protein